MLTGDLTPVEPNLGSGVSGTPALDLFAFIEALPDPVLLVGIDRRIEVSNAAARELFGAGIDGAQILSCIRQPEAAAALEQGFRALLDQNAPGGPFEARKLMGTSSGEAVWQMHVTALRGKVGGQAGTLARGAPKAGRPVIPSVGQTSAMQGGRLIVSLRDISHVEEAEQQRRDFVANVSHEMRSPLTVLLGFIETLRGTARDDPAARDHFLSIMEREAQRMTRLVADLLSLSKVEGDEKIRPRGQVSLSEVLQATVAALRPQIDEAGIRVDLRDEPATAPISGDRDQLVQVFHNLVENALKYGASGGRIEIVAERLDSFPGLIGPILRVSVVDHGEGIDPIHLPRLTERFYRVDGHRSRQMGGTGLGLAIVKHIIARHRGRLTIRSVRGQGSTFVVLLPCG